MKKKDIMPSVVLAAICIVVALMLAVVNMVTAPIIAERQNALANEALLEVLPEGKNFKEIEITNEYPEIVTAGYKADGGYVFQMTVTGKSAGMIIMCGIDSNGKIVATKVIANEETPSYAEKVFPNVEGTGSAYAGMDLDGFTPYLVSGATLTSKAYSEAIKAALQSAAIAGGADVDTRTPEQILQDNCNAALGVTGKTFKKWFATALIEGVDAVYEAADNSGRVYVIGENFIGVNADGTVVTAGSSAEDTTTVTAANNLINSNSLTDIMSALTDGKYASITKAYSTALGNYVFEIKAEGYKYYSNSYYSHGNNQTGHMHIAVSISADGKIIDVLTVSHSESKGYGDKCALDEYYEQYIGASNSDIVISADSKHFDVEDYEMDFIPNDSTDIGVISGATFTTVAYQTAVKLAFAAFELLTAEGGNE